MPTKPLFLPDIDPNAFFKKEANLSKMPDDDRLWPSHVLSEMHKALPYLTDLDVEVVLDRVEPVQGYGLGYATVRNKTAQAPEEALGKAENMLRIPIIIQDRELDSFHVFEVGGTSFPLTQERIKQATFNPSIFDGDVGKLPFNKSLIDQVYPPYQQRQGFGRTVEPNVSGLSKMGAAQTAEFLEKTAAVPMDFSMATMVPTQDVLQKAKGLKFRTGVLPSRLQFHMVRGTSYLIGLPKKFAKALGKMSDQGAIRRALMIPMREEALAARSNMPSLGKFVLLSREGKTLRYIKPKLSPMMMGGQKLAGVKTASGMEVPAFEHLTKVAMACGMKRSYFGDPEWGEQFEGTPVERDAIQLQMQGMQLKQQEQEMRAAESEQWAAEDAERDQKQMERIQQQAQSREQRQALSQQRDQMDAQVIQLEIQLLEHKMSLLDQGEQAALEEDVASQEAAAAEQQAAPQPPQPSGQVMQQAMGMQEAPQNPQTAHAPAGVNPAAGPGQAGGPPKKASFSKVASVAKAEMVMGVEFTVHPHLRAAYEEYEAPMQKSASAISPVLHRVAEKFTKNASAVHGGLSCDKAHPNMSHEEWIERESAKGRSNQEMSRGKEGSICSKIASTVSRKDFARFDEVFDKGGELQRMVSKSAAVVACLQDLTSDPTDPTDLSAFAVKAASMQRTDVIQIRPEGYGYKVKYASAPDSMAPQEFVCSTIKARQMFPADALKVADTLGVATLTNVEASPDTLHENWEAASEFGVHEVVDRMGNKRLGFIIPEMHDPMSGKKVANSALFVGDGEHAIHPAIPSRLMAKEAELPVTSRIRGYGVFVKQADGGVYATVPVNIDSTFVVEGEPRFVGNINGIPTEFTPVKGLKVAMAGRQGEVLLPDDMQFVALGDAFPLQTTKNPLQEIQKEATGTMAEIRAWPGGVDLRGPVFEKLGTGTYDWADGLFWLAAAGMPQNMAIEVMNKCAEVEAPLQIFGLVPLTPFEDRVANAVAEAAQKLASMPAVAKALFRNKPCLLKEAAAIEFDKQAYALADADSVDVILSLNFLSPENVSTFLESLPRMEETATKLASVVLASQLGLSAVPKTAAVRAMFALEDVISGLRTLKTYSI